MKKNAVILIVCLFFLSANAFAKSKEYGKSIVLDKATKISAILDDPASYIGKRVQVKGMVLEVCAKRGCWIYISSDRPYEKIQIKVTDGEIVFPMSASGKSATVEGIVDELIFSKDELIAWKRHQAEERGESFDPSTVKGNGKIVRIVGIGAVVEE